MRQAVEEILNGKFNRDKGSLDFSCQSIRIELHADAAAEGSFMIYGPAGRMTEGEVVSSDLRMECITRRFSGLQDEIFYRFDAHGMEPGEEAKIGRASCRERVSINV